MSRAVMVPLILLSILIAVLVVWPEFLDFPSLLLTVGGSISIVCFSYSRAQLLDLLNAIRSLWLRREQPVQSHIAELLRLTRLYRLEGLRGLESQEHGLTDAYLKQGVSMLIDLQKEERIRAKLEYELADCLGRHEISRQILLTLGKLLPAFGLIGTLVGMVVLLRSFSGTDGQSLTGALSLAVLTTLYGAVFANVVVTPLAAKLQVVASEKEIKMRLTLEWILLLVRGETPTVMATKLGALLPPVDAPVTRRERWDDFAWSAQR